VEAEALSGNGSELWSIWLFHDEPISNHYTL